MSTRRSRYRDHQSTSPSPSPTRTRKPASLDDVLKETERALGNVLSYQQKVEAEACSERSRVIRKSKGKRDGSFTRVYDRIRDTSGSMVSESPHMAPLRELRESTKLVDTATMDSPQQKVVKSAGSYDGAKSLYKSKNRRASVLKDMMPTSLVSQQAGREKRPVGAVLSSAHWSAVLDELDTAKSKLVEFYAGNDMAKAEERVQSILDKFMHQLSEQHTLAAEGRGSSYSVRKNAAKSASVGEGDQSVIISVEMEEKAAHLENENALLRGQLLRRDHDLAEQRVLYHRDLAILRQQLYLEARKESKAQERGRAKDAPEHWGSFFDASNAGPTTKEMQELQAQHQRQLDQMNRTTTKLKQHHDRERLFFKDKCYRLERLIRMVVPEKEQGEIFKREAEEEERLRIAINSADDHEGALTSVLQLFEQRAFEIEDQYAIKASGLLVELTEKVRGDHQKELNARDRRIVRHVNELAVEREACRDLKDALDDANMQLAAVRAASDSDPSTHEDKNKEKPPLVDMSKIQADSMARSEARANTRVERLSLAYEDCLSHVVRTATKSKANVETDSLVIPPLRHFVSAPSLMGSAGVPQTKEEEDELQDDDEFTFSRKHAEVKRLNAIVATLREDIARAHENHRAELETCQRALRDAQRRISSAPSDTRESQRSKSNEEHVISGSTVQGNDDDAEKYSLLPSQSMDTDTTRDAKESETFHLAKLYTRVKGENERLQAEVTLLRQKSVEAKKEKVELLEKQGKAAKQSKERRRSILAKTNSGKKRRARRLSTLSALSPEAEVAAGGVDNNASSNEGDSKVGLSLGARLSKVQEAKLLRDTLKELEADLEEAVGEVASAEEEIATMKIQLMTLAKEKAGVEAVQAELYVEVGELKEALADQQPEIEAMRKQLEEQRRDTEVPLPRDEHSPRRLGRTSPPPYPKSQQRRGSADVRGNSGGMERPFSASANRQHPPRRVERRTLERSTDSLVHLRNSSSHLSLDDGMKTGTSTLELMAERNKLLGEVTVLKQTIVGLEGNFRAAVAKGNKELALAHAGASLSEFHERFGLDSPANTFVFANISNSFHLWHEHEEHMMDATLLFHEVCAHCLKALEVPVIPADADEPEDHVATGRIMKTMGDAVFAAFSSPEGAIEWCCAVQKRLLEVKWPKPFAEDKFTRQEFSFVGGRKTLLFNGLRVRMGIHTGRALPCHEYSGGMDYVGEAVHIAAQTAELASGGQIVITHDVKVSLDRFKHPYELRHLGRQLLKGPKDGIRMHQLLPVELSARLFTTHAEGKHANAVYQMEKKLERAQKAHELALKDLEELEEEAVRLRNASRDSDKKADKSVQKLSEAQAQIDGLNGKIADLRLSYQDVIATRNETIGRLERENLVATRALRTAIEHTGGPGTRPRRRASVGGNLALANMAHLVRGSSTPGFHDAIPEGGAPARSRSLVSTELAGSESLRERRPSLAYSTRGAHYMKEAAQRSHYRRASGQVDAEEAARVRAEYMATLTHRHHHQPSSAMPGPSSAMPGPSSAMAAEPSSAMAAEPSSAMAAEPSSAMAAGNEDDQSNGAPAGRPDSTRGEVALEQAGEQSAKEGEEGEGEGEGAVEKAEAATVENAVATTVAPAPTVMPWSVRGERGEARNDRPVGRPDDDGDSEAFDREYDEVLETSAFLNKVAQHMADLDHDSLASPSTPPLRQLLRGRATAPAAMPNVRRAGGGGHEADPSPFLARTVRTAHPRPRAVHWIPPGRERIPDIPRDDVKSLDFSADTSLSSDLMRSIATAPMVPVPRDASPPRESRSQAQVYRPTTSPYPREYLSPSPPRAVDHIQVTRQHMDARRRADDLENVRHSRPDIEYSIPQMKASKVGNVDVTYMTMQSSAISSTTSIVSAQTCRSAGGGPSQEEQPARTRRSEKRVDFKHPLREHVEGVAPLS